MNSIPIVRTTHVGTVFVDVYIKNVITLNPDIYTYTSRVHLWVVYLDEIRFSGRKPNVRERYD